VDPNPLLFFLSFLSFFLSFFFSCHSLFGFLTGRSQLAKHNVAKMLSLASVKPQDLTVTAENFTPLFALQLASVLADSPAIDSNSKDAFMSLTHSITSQWLSMIFKSYFFLFFFLSFFLFLSFSFFLSVFFSPACFFCPVFLHFPPSLHAKC